MAWGLDAGFCGSFGSRSRGPARIPTHRLRNGDKLRIRNRNGGSIHALIGVPWKRLDRNAGRVRLRALDCFPRSTCLAGGEARNGSLQCMFSLKPPNSQPAAAMVSAATKQSGIKNKDQTALVAPVFPIRVHKRIPAPNPPNGARKKAAPAPAASLPCKATKPGAKMHAAAIQKGLADFLDGTGDSGAGVLGGTGGGIDSSMGITFDLAGL